MRSPRRRWRENLMAEVRAATLGTTVAQTPTSPPVALEGDDAPLQVPDRPRDSSEKSGQAAPEGEERSGDGAFDVIPQSLGDGELRLEIVVRVHVSPSVGQRTPTVGAPAASPPGDVAAGQDGSGAPVAPEPFTLLRVPVPVDGLPDLDAAEPEVIEQLILDAARWTGVTDPAQLTWDSAAATRITFPQFPGREFWALEVRVADPAVWA